MKLTCIALLFAGAVFSPANAEIVSLQPALAGPGQLNVLVNVTGVFDAPHDTDFLFGYGFDVIYDPVKLAYLGETPGPLFDDLSSNPRFGAQVGGVASSILLGPGDFTEPLLLATLHFQLLAPTATISINGDPNASLDQGLAYLTASDPISASVTVPEPAAVWLLGTGLALCAVIRRRRRPVL